MYEDTSAVVTVGLSIILITLVISLPLFILIIMDKSNQTQDNIVTEYNTTQNDTKDEYDNQNKGWGNHIEYSPFDGLAVESDGSLTYADEVYDTPNVLEILITFIGIIGIIIAGGRVVVSILYTVFPFIFSIKKLESNEDEKQNDSDNNYYGYDESKYVDDDSRYQWVEDMLNETKQ